jgi:hypothetical protein
MRIRDQASLAGQHAGLRGPIRFGSDLKQLERAALIIRAYGHAATETLQATPWGEFIAAL